MANEPVRGSNIIAAVKPTLDANGEIVPVRLTADDSYTPPRLVVELPDRTLRALGVVTIGAGTSVFGIADTGIPAYTEAFAYVAGTSKVEYHGWAAPGSSKASLVWAIQKLTYSGDDITDLQWADGVKTFTKVWNDRATYTYS